MNKALGAEFIGKLYGDMQMTLAGDHRRSVDWLATGKAAVCVPCNDADLASAREQRLRVESVTQSLKEGDYVGRRCSLALERKSPREGNSQLES